MASVSTTKTMKATGSGPDRVVDASWKDWVMKPPCVGPQQSANPPKRDVERQRRGDRGELAEPDQRRR